MKEIAVITFTLCIFYRQAYTLPDRWTTDRDMSPLEHKQSQYSDKTIQKFVRNERGIKRKTSDSDGKIFFPDDEPKILENPASLYRPIGPVTTCHNSTFCEDEPHYPADFVKNAIRSRGDLRYLATINETEIGERFAAPVAALRPQASDGYDDDPLCLVNEQVVYPKSAENKKREWVFVVNDDEFPQGVRIETCLSENGPCRIIDGFADGYKTSCRQKYIYRQLAAVMPDGTITPDLFRFPSSCCCHVKFIGNPLTRMGAGKLDSDVSSRKQGE